MLTQPRRARRDEDQSLKVEIEDRAIARDAIFISSWLRAEEIERLVTSIGAMICNLTNPEPIEACRT